MAWVDVELKVVGAVSENPALGLLVLVGMRVAPFCLQHFFAEREIGAVLLLDHVNSDVDGGLGRWCICGHRQAHGDVKHVLSVNGQAPNQSNVLLGGGTEAVVIGGEGHRKEGEKEHDGGNAKVEEHVPTGFLQALFALFNGHFFHQLVLVLVNGQCTRCIKFLFGHKTPISSEHFKTATREPAHNGNR